MAEDPIQTRLTREQRTEIIKTYYRNHDDVFEPDWSNEWPRTAFNSRMCMTE
jgi:hypothetical protein